MFGLCVLSTKKQKPSSLFTEPFDYKILKNRLNQTKFLYKIYFNIFTLKKDDSKDVIEKIDNTSG